MRLKNKFKIACLFSLATLLSSNIAYAEPTKDQKMMMNEDLTMMDWFIFRNELDLINDGANKFTIETDNIFLHVGELGYNSFHVGLDYGMGEFYISNVQQIPKSPKLDNSKLSLEEGREICKMALEKMSEKAPFLDTTYALHRGFSSKSYNPYSESEYSLITARLKYSLKIGSAFSKTPKSVSCEIPQYGTSNFEKIKYSFDGNW